MARRTLKSELSTIPSFILDSGLAVVGSSCIAAIIDGSSSLPDYALGAVAFVAGAYILRRNFPTSTTKKTGQVASMSAWMVDNETGIKTAIMRWRESPQEIDHEFYFRGLGLPCQISETRFRKFIEIARRRQTNALYGDKNTLLYTTGDNYRRVKANEILSSNYFLSLRNPRWTSEDVRACKEILGYTRLLKRKGQGDAGRLVGDYGVGWYVQEAKRIWILLTRPPIKTGVFNDFQIFSLTKILKSAKVNKSEGKRA